MNMHVVPNNSTPSSLDILSPRLQRFASEVSSLGSDQAVSAFFVELEQKGLPLIEEIPGDSENLLVTFIAQAEPSAQSCLLIGSIVNWDLKSGIMSQIPSTAVWYKSIPLPRDFRGTYRLGLGDSLEDFDKGEWEIRSANWTSDPYNRDEIAFMSVEGRPQSRGTRMSVLSLPDAPQEPYLQPLAPEQTGTVLLEHVSSKILGNERRTWLYTPAGFLPSQTYPLLVIFDGDAYIPGVRIPTILDNLIARELIPPVVAVCLDSLEQKTRDRELPCNPEFIRSLCEEFIPWAETHCKLSKKPEDTFVAGSSFGGLASLYAALIRPDRFGNVLAQSGAFQWNPEWGPGTGLMLREVAALLKFPAKVYLDIGLGETNSWKDAVPGLIANRSMRDLLQTRATQLVYREYQGGHDYACWRSTFPEALIGLFK